MRALPENITRGQSSIADQGQYFQVKPEPIWLVLYLLNEPSTKRLKK